MMNIPYILWILLELIFVFLFFDSLSHSFSLDQFSAFMHGNKNVGFA